MLHVITYIYSLQFSQVSIYQDFEKQRFFFIFNHTACNIIDNYLI